MIFHIIVVLKYVGDNDNNDVIFHIIVVLLKVHCWEMKLCIQASICHISLLYNAVMEQCSAWQCTVTLEAANHCNALYCTLHCISTYWITLHIERT